MNGHFARELGAATSVLKAVFSAKIWELLTVLPQQSVNGGDRQVALLESPQKNIFCVRNDFES